MTESLGSPEKDHQKLTPEQIIEDVQLRIGYCLMLRERAPFNDQEKDCSSEESAYFLNLEKEYLTIPSHLQYQNLAGVIAEEHRPSIKTIWTELMRKKRSLDDTVRGLQSTWHDTPFLAHERFGIKGRTVDQVVNEYPQKIPRKHKKGIIHTVTPASKKLGGISRLGKWQESESGLRTKFHLGHRDYMITLRLYYELLLEENRRPHAEEKKTVISKDNPLREEIAHQNDMVRAINTAYQCVQIAKGAHHEQGKGRLRKYEGIPYAAHTLKVTLASLMDVFTSYDPNKTIDPILLAAIGPIHDTVEDTTYSLQAALNLIISRADVYDTSIDPKITLNFQNGDHAREIEEFKTRKVNLLKRPGVLKTMEAILRILTDSIPGNSIDNKAPLNKGEIKAAIEQNLFGEEQTLLHLGLLSKEDLLRPDAEKQKKIMNIKSRYHIGNQQKIAPCQTAKAFKDDHDNGKLTRFLIRANAIAARDGKNGKNERNSNEANRVLQHALILKFNDRANNLLTKPSNTDKQINSKLKDLRNAVERLIAWGIYDHDNQNYPLGNSLPRLIHTALTVYEDLAISHPGKIENIDRESIEKLEIWSQGKIEITRFQTSAKTETIMESYAENKKDDPKKLRGTIYQFTRQQQAA